jgi:hypothetical protein
LQAAATDSRHVKRAAITGSGRPLQAAFLTNGKTKEMRGTFQVDLGGEECAEGPGCCGSAAKLFEDKEGNGDVEDNERIFDGKLAAKAPNQNRPPREANPVLEAKRNKIKNADALCAKRVVVSSTWKCNYEARRVWVEVESLS